MTFVLVRNHSIVKGVLSLLVERELLRSKMVVSSLQLLVRVVFIHSKVASTISPYQILVVS